MSVEVLSGKDCKWKIQVGTNWGLDPLINT